MAGDHIWKVFVLKHAEPRSTSASGENKDEGEKG